MSRNTTGGRSGGNCEVAADFPSLKTTGHGASSIATRATERALQVAVNSMTTRRADSMADPKAGDGLH